MTNHPNRSKAARRLRDAAPAMLAALEYILDRRAQYMGHAHVPGGNTEGCARCIADAAIKAAKGE